MRSMQVSDASSKQTAKQSANVLKHLVLIIDELDISLLKDLVAKLEADGLESLSLYTSEQVNLQETLSQIVEVKLFEKGKARKNLLSTFKSMLLNNEDLSPSAIQAKFNPEPDLIIKVSKGLESLEGTLIIEASYAEIYFAKVDAKDFTLADLEKAIEDFKQRKRNFGK